MSLHTQNTGNQRQQNTEEKAWQGMHVLAGFMTTTILV
jgi:hypothetical protein